MTKSALGHKRTYAVQNAMSALCPIAAAKADISSQIALPAWAKPYAQIRGITVGHEERILFAVALPPPRPCSLVSAELPQRSVPSMDGNAARSPSIFTRVMV
jgi:hypothetical protein